MENQIFKVINYIKYVSKKKPCTLKSLTTYKITMLQIMITILLKLNWTNLTAVLMSYKIINPIQEVMNFATEDEVIIYSEKMNLTIHIKPLHALRLIHLKLLPQLWIEALLKTHKNLVLMLQRRNFKV